MIRFVQMLLLLLPLSAYATIDAYEFSNQENEKRFHELTHELRCPKCQNQNIADSDAPLATDLRREVHRMLESGESNDEIADFMVTRYGDFVLYRPRVNETTWLLWYGPFVLLGVGILVVVLISRNRRQGKVEATEKPMTGSGYKASEGLSTGEADRLNTLLQRDSDQ
ncbi:cytochrome c-type biogenesis protein CcmH [Marinobacterium halophilum]|uniref:Cytochrome c-type biogenesis protein n=1 Tax=Marinobacterium halophilum TaxID=267374 RepID=A0A2P8ESD0_9GAMM|nr:cytochrome c-type biogenesis protein [Marinobacterium halophilum]PSL12396.1 cytochrome c-type biogenesis protein CcmH [Marinobacterium halophilum]